ncbi:TPA: RusA family crossover junction endodeoxyribonuclease [Streptococcus pyogenes]|uniref:RusA family crossover junction endodeoxyribonuclease n=1 Tax=Streptococcus pyogenes TaxID=1314 RepID=UPI000DA26C31|nr:RusA family crossover junction endodeoxyribonuclease [Streptococcus pyogenes]SQF09284.1 phage protein [Streptococcus pyogenes]HEQ3153208.1 RusA family crossover junction endodeoxyribonuclease [Streptococcus pyogenes]
MVKFIIPIEPKPQKRPRFSRWSGAYEDGDMMAWRKQVTDYVKNNYEGPYFDDGLKVDVTFYLKAPELVSKKPSERARDKTKQKYQDYINEHLYVPKKPDLDNLEKAVYDSISKSEVVWTDDNIIVEHTTRKLYSPNPRIEVKINEL